MTAGLRLAPSVASRVLKHALDEAPLECCGILTGPDRGHAATVHPAANVHGNPRTEYEIDPDHLLRIVERTEADDEAEIVGFYHSHPRGPAGFSQTDQERGAWPGSIYLLVSLRPLAFTAGRWEGDGFEPLPVHAHTPR